MKKRVIRLTEDNLVEIIKKIIGEQEEGFNFETLSDEELVGLHPFWKLEIDEDGNKMISKSGEWEGKDENDEYDTSKLDEFLNLLISGDNKSKFDDEIKKRGITFWTEKEERPTDETGIEPEVDNDEDGQMIEQLNKFKKMSNKKLIELNPSWRLIERDNKKIIKSAINESNYINEMDKFITYLGNPGVKEAYDSELKRRKIFFTKRKKI